MNIDVDVILSKQRRTNLMDDNRNQKLRYTCIFLFRYVYTLYSVKLCRLLLLS